MTVQACLTVPGRAVSVDRRNRLSVISQGQQPGPARIITFRSRRAGDALTL
jgi:hypothetical protein